MTLIASPEAGTRESVVEFAALEGKTPPFPSSFPIASIRSLNQLFDVEMLFTSPSPMSSLS